MGKQEKRMAEGKSYAEYVMSFLDEGARTAVDAAGYDLLRRNGFDVTGVTTSEKSMRRLAADMERRRTELKYHVQPLESERSNVIVFELIINGRCRDKQAVRVDYRDKEDGNGDESGAGDQA